MWAKIVLNLISNALKFTFEGGIAVSVDRRGRLGAARGRRHGHRDRGRRPAAACSSASTASSTRARARTRARASAWRSSPSSPRCTAARSTSRASPGAGSRFVVRVPLGEEQAAREVEAARTTSPSASRRATWPRRCAGSSPAPRRRPTGAGERPLVLVVDDNADMRDYIAALLADEYRVETAPDGAVALERARARPPDLVLTDVMMPHLDGFGLLRALQEDRAAVQRARGDGLRARGRGGHDRGPRGRRRRLPRQAVLGPRAARPRARQPRARPRPPHARPAPAQPDAARPGAAAGARRQLGDRPRRPARSRLRGVRPPAGDDARGARRDGRRGGG